MRTHVKCTLHEGRAESIARPLQVRDLLRQGGGTESGIVDDDEQAESARQRDRRSQACPDGEPSSGEVVEDGASIAPGAAIPQRASECDHSEFTCVHRPSDVIFAHERFQDRLGGVKNLESVAESSAWTWSTTLKLEGHCGGDHRSSDRSCYQTVRVPKPVQSHDWPRIEDERQRRRFIGHVAGP